MDDVGEKKSTVVVLKLDGGWGVHFNRFFLYPLLSLTKCQRWLLLIVISDAATLHRVAQIVESYIPWYCEKNKKRKGKEKHNKNIKNNKRKNVSYSLVGLTSECTPMAR